MDALRIEPDDLTRPQVHALLAEHLRDMHAQSPPESVHALDVDALKAPGIAFWTAWRGADLVACGALKALSPTHAEIKAMCPDALAEGRAASVTPAAYSAAALGGTARGRGRAAARAPAARCSPTSSPRRGAAATSG